MIRYALKCVGDHRFEAWFSSSSAYDAQHKRELVECPICGSHDVSKQIMAPAVRASGEKSNRNPSPQAMAAKFAGEVRRHIATTHDYVGDKFAEEARSMYYGETDQRPARAVELLQQGFGSRVIFDVPADPKVYGATYVELAQKLSLIHI